MLMQAIHLLVNKRLIHVLVRQNALRDYSLNDFAEIQIIARLQNVNTTVKNLEHTITVSCQS